MSGSSRTWTWVALAIFSVGIAWAHSASWQRGPRAFVPTQAAPGGMGRIVALDQNFVVAQVARNARTLLREPTALYDAPYCFPAEKTFALGEPMLVLGLLAIPTYALTEDPILAYNAALVLGSGLAALAMFLLVRDWTASPVAGIVAGLLYVFPPVGLADVVHPYVMDTSGTVLALWFGGRWLAHGRWRDALGMALGCSLQMAASFYPFVAGFLLGIPVGIALLVVHRKTPPPGQLASVAVLVSLAGYAVFGPYIALRGRGTLATGVEQLFLASDAWLETLNPGIWAGCLVLLALVLPRRRMAAAQASILRWGLLIGGAVLTALVVAGEGDRTPGALFAAVSGLIPGLDSVRLPWKISIGVHLVLSALAGIGCAGLARLGGDRHRIAISSALIGVTVLSLAWVAAGNRAVRFEPFRLRPAPQVLNFYGELARLGNRGPIFEVPPRLEKIRFFWPGTARQILLSAYHGRRTQACHASHPHPARLQLEEIYERLPAREAVGALARMGFTTLVVHRGGASDESLAAALDTAVEGGWLAPVHAIGSKAAYAIRLP